MTGERWKTSTFRHIEQGEGWGSWKELCRAIRGLAGNNCRPVFRDDDWRTLERFVRTLRKEGLILLRPGSKPPVTAPLHFIPERPAGPKPRIIDRPARALASPPPRSAERPVTPLAAAASADTVSSDEALTSSPTTSAPTTPSVEHSDTQPPSVPSEAEADHFDAPSITDDRLRGFRGWVSRLFGLS